MSCLEQMPLHYTPATEASGSQVTEITMRSDAHLSRPMLAAMMIELSSNVVSNSKRDLSEIGIRALERGKSHTVAIMLDRPLRDDERQALEAAALAGSAECLVIFMQS